MALCMNRIIDFDLSKTENKFTVKTGVDSELDMSKYDLVLAVIICAPCKMVTQFYCSVTGFYILSY